MSRSGDERFGFSPNSPTDNRPQMNANANADHVITDYRI